MFGSVDWDDIKTPTIARAVAIEDDTTLRERLIYVAGDTAAAVSRIQRASGAQLDMIAEEHGLKRRRIG